MENISRRQLSKSPYKMRKVRGKDCYKTYNKTTKRVFAICTTKEKALRQLALIRNKIYTSKKRPL